LARRPNEHGLAFPSPRSDSVWNSENFRAEVFAKAVKRAAAKVKPPGEATSSGWSSTICDTRSRL
jgi:hypothetical protein